MATSTKDQALKSWMPALVAELGEKCDRRNRALLKAVDALEEIMRLVSLSKKKMDDKHRLYFTICDQALEYINEVVGEHTIKTNHKPEA